MNLNDLKSETMESLSVKAEVYSPGSWKKIQGAIIEIETMEFKDKAFSAQELQEDFENRQNVNIVLRHGVMVIGFTSTSINGNNAHINNVVIHPDYQGRGLIGTLMSELENTLKSRAVVEITMDAAVENGYADKVKKFYGDRVLEIGTDKKSPWGLQRFFRISL